jgi:hypothetical protein
MQNFLWEPLSFLNITMRQIIKLIPVSGTSLMFNTLH